MAPVKNSQFVAVILLKIKLCGNEWNGDTPPSVEALRDRADDHQDGLGIMRFISLSTS